MTRNKTFILILVASAMCQTYGEENMNKNAGYYGFQRYGKETLHSIHSNGTVALESTEVLGLVQVNGNLDAQASVMDALLVNGQVNLYKCLIYKPSTINGFLKASNTEFKERLTIASQKIILSMCFLDSLIIKKTTGDNSTQVVDLRGGSHVSGTIIVESGNGEIWISSDTKIISEQVIGAKIIKK